MRTYGPESVLVVSAHPDDDVIGCGASIAAHASAGDEVVLTYLTSGDAGNREYEPEILGPMREREAALAAETLGVDASALHFLRYRDKTLDQPDVARDAVARLIPLIRSCAPTLVYMPHTADGHPDHESAGRIVTVSLAEAGPAARVRGFEIWEPLATADEVVPISPTLLALKKAAMRRHETQMLKMDYVDLIERRAAARGSRPGEYAEAFQSYDPRGSA